MGNKHSAPAEPPPPPNGTYTALDTLLLGIFIPLFLLALREVIKLVDFIIHKLSLTLDPFPEFASVQRHDLENHLHRRQSYHQQQHHQQAQQQPTHIQSKSATKPRPKLLAHIAAAAFAERGGMIPETGAQKEKEEEEVVNTYIHEPPRKQHQQEATFPLLSKIFPLIFSPSPSNDNTHIPTHEGSSHAHTHTHTHTHNNNKPTHHHQEAAEAQFQQKLEAKCMNLIGFMLDDVFHREYGSAVVRSMGPGLKHQCFVMEFMKRMKQAEVDATLLAASNPMLAKQRGTDIETYMGATIQKRLTSARLLATARGGNLAADGVHQGIKDTNYPHAVRYNPPELRERTRYWYYYQCLYGHKGKYWTLLTEMSTAFPVLLPDGGVSGSGGLKGWELASTPTTAGSDATSCSNGSGGVDGSVFVGEARMQQQKAQAQAQRRRSSVTEKKTYTLVAAPQTQTQTQTHIQAPARRQSVAKVQSYANGAHGHNHTHNNNNNIPHYMQPLHCES